MMWDWRSEWAVIKAALPELEPFLFSGEIYWPLSFAQNEHLPKGFNPRLSAGRLMLAIHILSFFSLQDAEIARLISPDLEKIRQLLNDWKSNWTNKALKEYTARMRQWKSTINEIHAGHLSQAEYSTQVQIRLLISLLRESAGTNIDPALIQELTAADQILKSYTSGNDFIWNSQLEDAFPEDRYWYLFRRIND